MALLLLPPKISFILVLAGVTLLQAPPINGDPFFQICGTTGNYTANSTYESNLNVLFNSLSTNGSISGFSTDTVGKISNKISGLILCRGDINATDCRACLDTADQDALQLCSYNKGAVLWYDYCLLRYSNQLFLSSTDNSPEFYAWNTQNATDPGRLDTAVEELMNSISNWAAYNSTRRFATGEMNYSGEQTKLYGLAQCTRDLSPDQCRQCLNGTYNLLRKGMNGGRALGVRCNVRYELYSFYNGASTLKVASPAAAPTGVPPSGERVGDYLYQICNETRGSYTAKSTFQSNLNLLLRSLPSDGSVSGFYNDTIGGDPDQVFGLVLCRGDTNATSCRSCLNVATHDVLQLCPYNKEAAIWYDLCFLRYSDQNILSDDSTSPVFYTSNTLNNTVAPDWIIMTAFGLMDTISNLAASNSRRFATMELDFSAGAITIYGLVQCIPDLSSDQCYQCLQSSIRPFQQKQRMGFTVVGIVCNIRSEQYLFYNGAPTKWLSIPPAGNGYGTATPVPTATGERGNKDAGNKNARGIVLEIIIPLVTALVVFSIICICFWRRRSRERMPYEIIPEEITSVESILFNLSTIKVATANFSNVNKLGQGGFGAVYKGALPNGREIGVKRLSTSSSQGLGELKNELVLVAKLQHRNLVRLLGACIEEEEKLLVYEYVPNRSLDTFLFDPVKCLQLNWGRRHKIIRGIARGLLYLHEDSRLKIIHRDLKASNILLDVDLDPKISDFGLARLSGGDQNEGTTSRIVGTFGYIAPEYAMFGQFSVKSDVFSFGVLILEIVTGRKNNSFSDQENGTGLLSYTWEHWTKGTIKEIVDPSLGEHYSRSEVHRCIQIGLLCVQEDPADRPTMSTVVLMLNSHPLALEAPSRPAFCISKNGMKRFQNWTIPSSPNELSISQMDPR